MKNRRYLILFVTFSLGFGCAILFGAVIDFYDLAISPSERLVRQWEICEDEEGRLLVPLLEDGVLLRIAHKPESNRLESIYIMKEEAGFIFEYKMSGEFGVPWAQYSGGFVSEEFVYGGPVWMDLDGNGYFDKRLIGKKLKKLEVLIDNQWVRAKKAKGRLALTDRGVFEFDTDKGKWCPSRKLYPN